MPVERKPVWNLARQIPGNLIPALLAAPFLVVSVDELARHGPTAKGLFLGLGFLAVGWLAVNFIGLIGNASLRRAVEMRFKDTYGFDRARKWFVGFSRPGHRGLLDPHEDVGFLVFRDGLLEYFGERYRYEIPFADVRAVKKRPNVHSVLGLGGWVSVEAEAGGKPVRLLVEPRERPTHWGNARLRNVLTAKILEQIHTPQNYGQISEDSPENP